MKKTTITLVLILFTFGAEAQVSLADIQAKHSSAKPITGMELQTYPTVKKMDSLDKKMSMFGLFLKNELDDLVLQELTKDEKLADTRRVTHVNDVDYRSTLMYLKIPDTIKKKYVLQDIGPVTYVGAFIKCKDSSVKRDLLALGAKVSYTGREILTVYIPVSEIRKVLQLPGVLYVDAAVPVTQRLDEARKMTRVNGVNAGIQLPKGYTGKGVMIGVIDVGFDFGHPAFYDSLGNYRVAAFWNQNDNTGNKPDPFGYGSEFVTQQEILDEETDDEDDSHGTHVAGITSGANWSTTQEFKGVAYDSKMTLISYAGDPNNLHIYNAILYAYSKGFENGMPTVVNMSLGGHIGPHDGTSLFDKACDQLLSNGEYNLLSIVGAAGNEGDKKLHISKQFSNTDTSVSSFIVFEGRRCGSPCLGVNGNGQVDIWGEAEKILRFQVNIFDKKSRSFYYRSPIYSTSEDANYVQNWATGDVFYSLITKGKESINGKPHIFLDVNSLPIVNDDYQVLITVLGENSVFHAWANHEYYVSFSDEGLGYRDLLNGDSLYSVGEIGGTGKSIISVGAYNSSYTNQQIGGRASFSSIGPTVDGRIKPDISAPGNRIASSVNSFDLSYINGDFKDDVVTTYDFRGRKYNYALMEGTSMSSPMVTGIIALWKEASPLLSTNQIKEVLTNTSIRDGFTGSAPNNLWGQGKIDAYSGIRYILSKMPAKPVFPFRDTIICAGQEIMLAAPAGFASYLWSTGDTTRYIRIDEEGEYSVFVKNSSGWWSNVSEPVTVYVDSVDAVISRFEPDNCLNSIYLRTEIEAGQSLQWYRNDVPLSGATSAQLIPQLSGTYKLRVQNNDSRCFDFSDTIIVDMTAYTNRLFKSDSIKSCSTDSVELDAGAGFKKYLWSTGATTQKIKVAQTGKYSVTVNCGEDIVNFGFLQFPANSPNSTRSFLNIPDAPQLDFRDEMSMMMILNVGAINSSRPTILNKGSDASYQVVISWPMLIFSYPGMDKTDGLRVQIPQNSWFSVAVVKTKDSVFLYYNGNIVDRGSGKKPIPVNNEPITIGKRAGVDFDFFVGGIDQISFWNKGLTTAEVRNYLNCATGNSPGCVGFYNFDPSERDQSPFANHASFYNSAVGGCCGGRYGTSPFTICSGASFTTDSIYVQIEALPKGVTRFSWDKSCVDQSISFRNESDSTTKYPLNWAWDMGDGTRYTTSTISHTYRRTGNYSVRLNVTSPACSGFSDGMIRQISISAPVKPERYLPVDVRKNTEKQVQARSVGQKFRWLPGSGVTDSLLMAPKVKISKETDFRIAITDAAGCVVTDSLLVRVFDRYTVFVPSGFSPDGNGVNDKLRPILVGIKEIISFRVYSRWGNLVYTSKTADGWDGTFNGMLLPSDTYTWVFEGIDDDGNKVLLSGKTTLIR